MQITSRLVLFEIQIFKNLGENEPNYTAVRRNNTVPEKDSLRAIRIFDKAKKGLVYAAYSHFLPNVNLSIFTCMTV